MKMTMKSRKGWRKPLVLSAVLAAFAIVAAGCSAQPEAQAAGAAGEGGQAAIKTVKIAEIQRMQIAAPQEQVADVLASAQVSVVAKAGGDVKKLVRERGETVQAGDALVELDDTDARLSREQAQLQLESARLQLESGRKQWEQNVAKLELAVAEAAKAYNKALNDYEKGLIGKSELNQAETAYKNAKADLDLLLETSVTGLELQAEAAELAVQLADRNLAHYRISAPIGGILTQLNVQEGMTVSPGFVIGEIQQIDPIKIRTVLSADAAGKVRGKKELSFYVPGDGRMHAGTVTYLADVMDAQTGGYELNLSAPNPDRALKPGMKVQVRLTEDEDEVVTVVPTTSIVREGSETFVFVLDGSVARKRKVALGRLNGLNQEVLSGVSAGEKLIVSGQHQLKDGEEVKVAE